jgi:hypothetical protein
LNGPQGAQDFMGQTGITGPQSLNDNQEIDGPRGITMEEAHEIAIKNMQ